MLSLLFYLIRILEKKEKKALQVYWVLSMLTPVADLASISILLPILKRLTDTGHASEELIFVTLGVAALVACKGGLELYRNQISNGLVYDGAQRMSVKLYELLMREDLPSHNERGAMQAVTLLRTDSVVGMQTLVTAVSLTGYALTLAGFSVMLIVTAGWLGFFCYFCFFLCMVGTYFFYKKNMDQYGKEKRKQEIRVNAQITITYGVFKELTLSESKQVALEQYETRSRKFAETEGEYLFKTTIAGVILNHMLQASLFFFLALGMVLEVKLTEILAEIIVSATLLIRMLPIGSGIVRGLHRIEYGRKSCQSLRDAMKQWKEIKENEKKSGQIRKKTITLGEGVRIRDLTFAYRENEPVFTAASMDLPVGKSIGVIGPSGSGKSTLLDLLLGLLQPQKGSIYYDDYEIVSKTDARGACEGNLGELVSYIPQTIYLNGGTVRENVAFFAEEIEDDRVREALDVAQVLEDVERLPQGIYSLLGEQGSIISGGQRQRIALARALYKEFELLLMDEAMAALDTETETAVMDAIRHVKGNKTILLVTHHKNLADLCDLLYKIEDQKLVRIR
ncbi:MAG: ABC transporter ATP-binding protein [Lachnospiraceae bacterium]|nr:ABC transporter ATP-binding protein [Lachnospiraceae bacterium]